MNSKITFLNNIEQHKQKSEKWLEQRKGRLTSSDAATALGMNKYENEFGLLLKKCNHGPKFEGNEATKHGEKYETEAINWYCKLLNKKNYEFGLIDYDSLKQIRKPSKLDSLQNTEFIAGSPDGVAEDLDNMEDLVLLEVKCPMRRKIIFGEIPECYYPQVQLNMAIFDLYKADYIEYIPKGISPFYLKEPMLNIVRVHRNDNWLLTNIPKLYLFWQQVLIYRQIGVSKHPEYPNYVKKIENSDKRTTNKINKFIDIINNTSIDEETENTGLCFRDSDSDCNTKIIKTELQFRDS